MATGTAGQSPDTIDGIPWGQVELEPEVAGWLERLDDQRWAAHEVSRAMNAMTRCQQESHTADEDQEEG